MSIEAHGIRKQFGSYTALDGVDLNVPQGKLVALLGVNDLVVVDTPDALLITTRQHAQDVGKVVKHLDEKKLHKLV